MANPATFDLAPPDTRRGRFQRYMRAFNPTQSAAAAIGADLVDQELRGDLHRRIAARAEIEPASQQLLMGGIGSGKTTELLLIEAQISGGGVVRALPMDVSAATNLTQLQPGALLACLGLKLLATVPKNRVDGTTTTAIKQFAHDHWTWVPRPDADYEREYEERDDDEELESVRVKGHLQPPLPRVEGELLNFSKHITALLSISGGASNVIALFDGLDKLMTPADFWKAGHQDLRVLKELGIPVVLAAPLVLLYAQEGPQVLEHFDSPHLLFDIPTNSTQMRNLIQRRNLGGAIPGDLFRMLSDRSGGVIRDLMTLARDAGESAYMDSRDEISQQDIDRVAARLGRSYLRGLGPTDIVTLRELDRAGTFDPTSAQGLRLLATRRVLEYSETEFGVHPALLRAMGEPSRG